MLVRLTLAITDNLLTYMYSLKILTYNFMSNFKQYFNITRQTEALFYHRYHLVR